MNFGRMPFHDEQRLPPDKRSPSPPPPDQAPSPVAFFLERDKAFGPTMDRTAIVAFLRKYEIPFPSPTKSPIPFWTMVYTAVLSGRIGGDGSRERAIIWLNIHRHQGLISWQTSTGIYRFNGKSYRLNHKLMLRKAKFHDSSDHLPG